MTKMRFGRPVVAAAVMAAILPMAVGQEPPNNGLLCDGEYCTITPVAPTYTSNDPYTGGGSCGAGYYNGEAEGTFTYKWTWTGDASAIAQVQMFVQLQDESGGTVYASKRGMDYRACNDPAVPCSSPATLTLDAIDNGCDLFPGGSYRTYCEFDGDWDGSTYWQVKSATAGPNNP